MATPASPAPALRFLLHFVVVTSVGDTVVYESSYPSQLPETLQLDLEFFLHASLDTLDLLCREKPDCFFPTFETAGGDLLMASSSNPSSSNTANRSVSAYCPIGPYRLLLVVEPQVLKRDDVKNFFAQCSKILADHLRNPMASIHSKIQSQGVKDGLRQQLERLQRTGPVN
jgi:hypothetical protein